MKIKNAFLMFIYHFINFIYLFDYELISFISSNYNFIIINLIIFYLYFNYYFELIKLTTKFLDYFNSYE